MNTHLWKTENWRMRYLILYSVLITIVCCLKLNTFIKVDLSNTPLAIIPEDFIGQATDASIIVKPIWKKLDFDDETFLTYIKGISPTYLRFGGLYTEHTTFRREFSRPNRSPKSALRTYRKKGSRDIPPTTISSSDIDKLMRLVDATGSRLLYSLNSHQRVDDHWDPENSLDLIDYTIEKGYSAKIDWGIGNEPLKTYNISGRYIGEAVGVLRAKLDGRNLSEAKIVAPDLSRDTEWGLNLLADTVDAGGKNLSAVSFHQYYLDSRTAKWRDYFDSAVLNQLSDRIKHIRDTVGTTVCPDKPVWLTESGSSYGGGSDLFSRGYAAALGFADKIGVTSKLGVHRLVRQALFGGKYRLLDSENNYEPSAEYWITYLFYLFGGTHVKATRSQPIMESLRCYAFERMNKTERMITLLILNVSEKNSYQIRFMQPGLLSMKREDYVIRAAGHPSNSTMILVNDESFQMENFTLPQPKPESRKSGDPVYLKPLEMAFVVFRSKYKKPEKRFHSTDDSEPLEVEPATLSSFLCSNLI